MCGILIHSVISGGGREQVVGYNGGSGGPALPERAWFMGRARPPYAPQRGQERCMREVCPAQLATGGVGHLPSTAFLMISCMSRGKSLFSIHLMKFGSSLMRLRSETSFFLPKLRTISPLSPFQAAHAVNPVRIAGIAVLVEFIHIVRQVAVLFEFTFHYADRCQHIGLGAVRVEVHFAAIEGEGGGEIARLAFVEHALCVKNPASFDIELNVSPQEFLDHDWNIKVEQVVAAEIAALEDFVDLLCDGAKPRETGNVCVRNAVYLRGFGGDRHAGIDAEIERLPLAFRHDLDDGDFDDSIGADVYAGRLDIEHCQGPVQFPFE